LLISGVVLLAVIAAAGCVGDTELTGPADTLYLGNVITMDDKNPTAEAVAVKDSKILFVGSAKDAEKYCDADTEVIDYGENSIYPGFMEAHMHVSLAGMRDYGMFELSSGAPLEENVKELQKYVQEHPGQKVYIGYGWTLADKEPTAAMIDAVVSDVPVILQTRGGHEAWVNSKELEILNYSPEYIKEMGPQQIHVDANGKPTGFIQELPAIKLVNQLPFTLEELKGFVLKWQEKTLASGFTAVCDAGIELCGDSIYQAISELEAEGKLKIRIYGLSLVRDNTDTPEEDMARIADLAKKYDSEHFKIIGAKIFLDGVTETHTSWLLEPYVDMPESTGVQRFNDVDKMAALMTAANKYGMLVHGHVMGDGAAHAFASAVEKSVKETGNYDQRNAAAHIELVTPEDKERFGKYGIIAVSFYQMSPKIPGMAGVEPRVGAERAKMICGAQSFIDAGAVVVGHSDYPISPLENVPFAVYTAVTREMPLMEAEPAINPDERLSREDALKALTSNVAYMWHEEDRMGTLEAGKLANMAVFAVDFVHDDLNIVAASLLLDNVATIVDGKVVYSAEPLKMTDEEYEKFMNLLPELYEFWAADEGGL
ncbi:MAG TPA: amidohydrolase, partial [Methanocorpusculum sp.]|nr:amidohydrolase [Methanocorpusculum sp.]